MNTILIIASFVVAFIVLDTIKLILQYKYAGYTIRDGIKYKAFVYETRWLFIHASLIRNPKGVLEVVSDDDDRVFEIDCDNPSNMTKCKDGTYKQLPDVLTFNNIKQMYFRVK